MRVAFIALAAALAGCSPSLTGANERGGIVTHVIGLTMDQAFTTADAHCHHFDRVARVSSTDPWGNTMTFDCVER